MRTCVVAQAQRWVVLKFGGTSVSRRNRWDTIGRARGQTHGRQTTRACWWWSRRCRASPTNCRRSPMAPPTTPAGAAIDALVQRHRAFCAELDLDADAVLGERLAALRALRHRPARRRRARWTGRPRCWRRANCCRPRWARPTCAPQGLDFGWCDARDWLRRRRAAEPERVGAAAVGELPQCSGDAGLRRALRRAAGAHAAHPGLHRPPRRRRHRDPRARRFGHLGRVLRRAARRARGWRSGPTCPACSAPIRARCPMRAC